MTATPKPSASRPNINSPIPRAVALAVLTASGFAIYGANAEAEAIAAQTVPSSTGDQHTETPRLKVQSEPQDLINWSGTHAVSTDRYYQPETVEELKAIVQHSHKTRQKLRPVGSGLSPNGLPFDQGGMVNLVNMDALLAVDTKTNRVRVQAGARVSQVVEELRTHGLVLQNFASITEQQIGGLTQVGAHGTGAKIPSIDEQVVAMRIITPAAGEIALSIEDKDPSLFQLARTSLGLLGVVTEVTLQCVPAHRLIERTLVLSREEVAKRHRTLLDENRHLRYMWIPHTNDVIVVTCNPVSPEDQVEEPTHSNEDRLAPARALLKSHPRCELTDDRISQLHFMSLRDELLALDPLKVDWLKQVNEVEAQFWRRSQGSRIDWSDKILQFDCGGQQWVSEIAFPVHRHTGNDPDVQFMLKLLDLIEQENIAAPAPIEQRWCAPSTSPMSPVGEKPDKELAEFYSWVGIIMYLPDSEVSAELRENITKAFKQYKSLCERKLWPEVNAVEHWAKIEMPETEDDVALLQKRTANKYPVEAFKAICSIFDPHGILRNKLTNTIFGME